MSDQSNSTNQNETPPRPSRSRWGSLWFVLRMLEVRLRFLAVLVAIGLIIGYWDTLQNYWDRWTRPAVAVSSNTGSDTEFYCPMDPSVIRDSLEPNGSLPKCSICGMPLSLRKKGEPMKLPPGVVGRVSLTPDRVKMAGIRTSEISLRPMTRVIHSVGTVTYDESRQSQIVTRVSGYLEKLTVDRTFMQVRLGDPLAEIYSPELVAAIQELKTASNLSGSSLAKLAREKVRLLGIEDTEIDSMLTSDGSQHRVVIRSPSNGFVTRKLVQQGANVSAGQLLFEIADLTGVWIEADIFEKDIALLQQGQPIDATVDAYPNRKFSGTVNLIYPEMQTATRTNRVRFEIDNDELLLRVGMFATVNLETPLQQTEPFQSILATTKKPPTDPVAAIAQQAICPVTGAPLGSMGDPIPMIVNGQTVYLCCDGCVGAMKEKPDYCLSRIRTVTDNGVLSVPETAVIDTGEQQIVYIERETGVFEGVLVKLGPKVDGFYSVISGLLPGDQVAAAGAFLIDAETRLNPAASAAYFGASGTPSGSTSAGRTTSTTAEADNMPSMLPPHASQPADSTENASPDRFKPDELANIAKLGVEDQALVRQQVLCPITEMPLGSMGVPIRLMVKGEPVFVCCEDCTARAQQHADETLTKVHRWKSANQTTPK